jgi:hypothetical protein
MGRKRRSQPLMLDDCLHVPLRFFPCKRKKPPGFQGDSVNVEVALR